VLEGRFVIHFAWTRTRTALKSPSYVATNLEHFRVEFSVFARVAVVLEYVSNDGKSDKPSQCN